MPSSLHQEGGRTRQEMRACLKQRGAGGSRFCWQKKKKKPSPGLGVPGVKRRRGHVILTSSHGHTKKPKCTGAVGVCPLGLGVRGAACKCLKKSALQFTAASRFIFRPCCWISLMKVVLSMRSLVALVHITKSLYII